MTYTKAIELAVASGYKKRKGIENEYDDNHFWMMFSKAMGWKEHPNPTLDNMPIWHIKYCSFVDHVQAGNSPESWFKWVELNQNN